MSNLQEKAKRFSEKHSNGKHFRDLELGYENGFSDCQKEYEEKLRWIPVEERLPEIGIWIIIQLKKQSLKNKYVTMLPKNDFEINFIKENVISWRSFL